jgi:hypothetical protein
VTLPEEVGSPRVTLRYFEECPNWRTAGERLVEALGVLGVDPAGVVHETVETVEQAEEVGFTGSPTILIDGIDPFATGHDLVGLSCRMYATPTGLQPAPTTAQLVAAIGPLLLRGTAGAGTPPGAAPPQGHDGTAGAR